jgi:cobalt-zinc-cadmium efflux system membrane fusion protein
MRKRHLTALVMMILAAVLAGCGQQGEIGADERDHEKDGRGSDFELAAGEEHSDEGEHGAEIELTAAVIAELGIEITAAGPGIIDRTIDLPGEIKLNEDHVVHIVPRIGGIVREVRGRLGDEVKRGEVLAVIESRELADATAEYLASRERLSLAIAVHEREEQLWKKKISSEQEYLDAKQALSEARITNRAARQKLLALGISGEVLEEMPAQTDSDFTRYEILSPTSGTVIQKRISLGEVLEADRDIFIVADLGSVWLDISVHQKDLELVREGQAVTISRDGGTVVARGSIGYVGPVLEHDTRTALARIVLPNLDNGLRPGAFVKAHISVESEKVPVAVPRDALQTIDGETVLFLPAGDGFEAHPVTAGRASPTTVEIVSGLEPGRSYVSRGAFILKAKLVTGSIDSHTGHGH